MEYLQGQDREQLTLYSTCLDDMVPPDNTVRLIDQFVALLDLGKMGFESLETTKEQMTWFADSKQFWWAICSIDNETFYGAGGLNDLSEEHKKAEIGLWLLPDFWGKGIMTEAMPLICNYGFNELRLHRIEGFVESDNTNCRKAMAKLDFQHEGTMKDCEVKNGKFISVDIYAKLKA